MKHEIIEKGYNNYTTNNFKRENRLIIITTIACVVAIFSLTLAFGISIQNKSLEFNLDQKDSLINAYSSNQQILIENNLKLSEQCEK